MTLNCVDSSDHHDFDGISRRGARFFRTIGVARLRMTSHQPNVERAEALLKKKQEGKPIERPERPKPTNVVNLPPLVRSKIIEYREEKTAGLYGGPQHSEPDLPQANRAYGGSPARRKVP